MNKQLLADLRKVVDYNWADECADFNDGRDELDSSHASENHTHIFGSLYRLQQFLYVKNS